MPERPLIKFIKLVFQNQYGYLEDYSILIPYYYADWDDRMQKKWFYSHKAYIFDFFKENFSALQYCTAILLTENDEVITYNKRSRTKDGFLHIALGNVRNFSDFKKKIHYLFTHIKKKIENILRFNICDIAKSLDSNLYLEMAQSIPIVPISNEELDSMPAVNGKESFSILREVDQHSVLCELSDEDVDSFLDYCLCGNEFKALYQKV